jgi:hypothetical protein
MYRRNVTVRFGFSFTHSKWCSNHLYGTGVGAQSGKSDTYRNFSGGSIQIEFGFDYRYSSCGYFGVCSSFRRQHSGGEHASLHRNCQ